MPQVWVVAYGSLMFEPSRQRVLGTAPRGSFAATVRGYQRVWGVPASNNWMTLAAIRTDGVDDVMTVLCVEAPTDWRALDAREGGYDKVTVDPSAVTCYPSGTAVSDKDTFVMYVVGDPSVIASPTPQCPLLLSYIDIVTSGALSVSTGFAINFLRETKGWGVVLDDRGTNTYRPLDTVESVHCAVVDSELRHMGIRVSPMSLQFVICYGSLMNAACRAKTEHQEFAECFPVVVRGYRRRWGFPGAAWTPLGAERGDPSRDAIGGLCVGVRDFAALDARESGYLRERVPPANIVMFPSGAPARPNGVEYYIYTCACSDSEEDRPILLSYVDVVVAGAMDVGRSFADHIFDGCPGGWKVIMRDRERPRYRRAVPVDLSVTRYVDERLARIRGVVYVQVPRYFIVVYGATMGKPPPSMPLLVEGYRRVWGNRGSSGTGVGLSVGCVAASPGTPPMAAVAMEVPDWNGRSFARSQMGAHRVLLPPGTVKPFGTAEFPPRSEFSVYVTAGDDRGGAPVPPVTTELVRLSVLDCVAAAALEHGTDFAALCLYGIHSNVIDDRMGPPHQTPEAYHRLVDEKLKTLGPTD